MVTVPPFSVTSLGHILKSLGLIDDADLVKAQEIQVTTSRRIGEVLVELGKVTVDDIARALELQAKMRSDKPEEGMKALVGEQMKQRRRTNAQLAAICDV